MTQSSYTEPKLGLWFASAERETKATTISATITMVVSLTKVKS